MNRRRLSILGHLGELSLDFLDDGSASNIDLERPPVEGFQWKMCRGEKSLNDPSKGSKMARARI